MMLVILLTLAVTIVLVVIAGWAMRHADDQDHMPRSAEIPVAFPPRSDGG